MINYYHVLGLSESASDAEIKAAFKKLAVLYHPDKHEGSLEMEERFKEINQAYQVLSNPYEKARYDIQFTYGQPSVTYHYEPAESTYRPPRPRTNRPNYKEREINWRENWIATAYAFGFTFIMAIVVMAVIGVKDYYDQEKLAELMERRRQTFEEAKKKYQNGEVHAALSTINGLGGFMSSEQDMAEYKTDLFESFIFQAEHNYNQGVYNEAIHFYELIDLYAPRNPLQLQEHLAIAYRKVDQPKKSIKKLKELILVNYRPMETYLNMAQIYHDDLVDPEEAKRYYEVASEFAIQKYKAVYGDAYPLVVSGRFLPESHYHLYTQLARVYLETGDPERAVKATRWNIKIWPDSSENYFIAALGYEELGNASNACLALSRARSLGMRNLELKMDCP